MNIRIKIVKDVVEHYVRNKSRPVIKVNQLLPELRRQQACYVYLYQRPGQRLRAIYGSPLPRQVTLADEIVSNTISAIDTAHYLVIKRSDLSALVYSVAVLEPMQRISVVSQLDPSLYGLYVVTDTGKTAVVLPQRPGVETAQDQYATALREAGIRGQQEMPIMYRFLVNYYD